MIFTLEQWAKKQTTVNNATHKLEHNILQHCYSVVQLKPNTKNEQSVVFNKTTWDSKYVLIQLA